MKEGIKVWNILVADHLHPSLLQLQDSLPIAFDVKPEITFEETLRVVGKYHGIILRSKFRFGKELFEAASNLNFLGRGGAGLDGIDLDLAREKNIEVINAPEGNANAVAEHTLGMLLSLIHNLHKASLEVMDFKWLREENRGVELKDLVVGILGYGNMGKAFGELVKLLSKETIAFDVDPAVRANRGVRLVDFETLKERAEVLSVHIPLNEENRFLLDSRYFSGFRNLKFLINTARGKVLDLDAAELLLKNEEFRGLGLDVLPVEDFNRVGSDQKIQYERLFHHPKVLVTPHIAGWSIQSFEGISRALSLKIKNHILQNG